MPSRPCLTCGRLVAQGRSYCELHDPRPRRYREERGSGWAQSRFREVVLKQAGFRCERCGSTVGVEAHHVRPVAERGSHALANGVALCSTCHGQAEQGGRRSGLR